MKNLKELRTIMLSEKQGVIQGTRTYRGEWVEVRVTIGRNGSAYVQIPREDYDKLLELTGE